MVVRHLPPGTRGRRLTDPAPRPRRGRPPRLSRDQIVDAAEALVAAEGPEALTMRRVAQELSASPMAIYRHVADKDELLVALLDRLAATLPRPEFPADPRERICAAAQVIHDGLQRYPWVVDVLAQGDLIAPSILWVMDELVGALMACGLDEAGAARAYRLIWEYTVGSLLVARGAAHVAQLRRPPRRAGVLAAADPAQLPHLARLLPHWADAQVPFQNGISVLVEGLLASGM